VQDEDKRILTVHNRPSIERALHEPFRFSVDRNNCRSGPLPRFFLDVEISKCCNLSDS
jgi:hypothetical protein